MPQGNLLRFMPSWPHGFGYESLFEAGKYLESPVYREYRLPPRPFLFIPPAFREMPSMYLPDVLYFDLYSPFPPKGISPWFQEERPMTLTGLISSLLKMMG